MSAPLETCEFELQEGTLYTPSKAIVSPDQSWICYYLNIRRNRPRGALLQGKDDRKYRAFEALWVSRADGSGMREIGEVSCEPTTKKEYWHPLWDVQWMPDGKSLSFIYKQGLYVVRVMEEEEQK